MKKNRYTDIFNEAAESFEENYSQKAYNRLQGLSEEQIKEVAPDTTSKEIYQQLVETTKDATERNLSQAELSNNIKSLGETAVNIAKKIAKITDLF